MKRTTIRHASVYATLFCGALLLGWTAWRESRPSRPPDLRAVAEAVAAEHGWHVLSISSRQRRQLFYLSRRPLTGEQAAEFTTHPTHRGRWAGVVMVNEELGEPVSSLDDSDWGEWGREVGPHFIYGDPEMVAVLAKALAP